MDKDKELLDNLLSVVKQREGILNSIQDEYIKAIINGAIDELRKQQGIDVNLKDMNHFMFVVDLAAYRYSNRDSLEGMPQHLMFRLVNLYVEHTNDIKKDAEDKG